MTDETNPTRLKDAVRQHLEQQTLSAGQLSELVALQDQRAHQSGAGQPPRMPAWRVVRHWRHALVASALLVAVLTGFLVGRMPTIDSQIQSIATETIHNHLLHMPLEVRGSTIDAVAGYFDQLTFDVATRPRGFPDAQLLGGRYCSIQGQAAAQLRYQSDNAEHLTLYQVPLRTTLQDKLPLTLNMGQQTVSMWRDGALMLVRVENHKGT